MLINYYGKPYNEATSANDPGFPIVTAADVTETKFSRASVKEVYDFIVNDLTTAIPNLPVQITHRLRMSKAAAEGLLGKVYMFMGKFNEALPLLNSSFTDMTNSAVPVRLYDYQTEFATGGTFLPINSVSGPAYPTIVNNVEIVFGKQANNSWTSSSNEIVIKTETAALYAPPDLRLKFYSPTTRTLLPYPVAGVLRRQSQSQLQFGILVSDLYLLRAECKCRINDLVGAKADVEALRLKRMLAVNATVPSSVAAQQLSLLKFIMDERIREFAVFGFRWFDMRRLSVDPLFGTKDFTHTLYSAAGTPTVFTFRPERFVLQFAKKIIAQNPEVQNNP